MSSVRALVASIAFAALSVGARAARAEGPVAVGTRVEATEPAAPDEVWELRREPYHGGILRPGMQLEREPNAAMMGLGVLLFVSTWPMSLIRYNPISYVPIVGPWIALAGGPEQSEPSRAAVPLIVVSGIGQALGLAGILVGALTPRMFVLYEAPRGAPSLGPASEMQLALSPGAPGALLGGTLSLVHF